MISAVAGPPPSAYAAHWLHSAPGLAWPVSNCYSDMWIETLNWLGHDPLPALASALAVDFEGDQWTLFKPQPEDLQRLYGIGVCELNVWRPLREQLPQQLADGRLVITEADAFWLPDTAGSAYRVRHQKTTICVAAIDPGRRRLWYFHDAGYHALSGADYDGVLGWGDEPLPPYVEVVKLCAGGHSADVQIRSRAAAVVLAHVRRRPRANPYARAASRYDAAMAAVMAGGDGFHDYVFAGLRQAGAASQYAATLLAWLAEDVPALAAPAVWLDDTAQRLKTVLLKTARAVARGTPLAGAALLEAIAGGWADVMSEIEAALAVATAEGVPT